MEVIKQRRQTTNTSSLKIFKYAYKTEGISGLYRGFGTTVLREIPFAFVQFPVFEYLKVLWSRTIRDGKSISSWEVSLCGAAAGGIAASVTTPLDVIKTRIMLADQNLVDRRYLNTYGMCKVIYQKNGMKGYVL